MSILLQDTKSLKYINATVGWTQQHREARVFRQGRDALFFCYLTGLPNMIMLFEFTDRRMNFNFPVTDDLGN